MNLKNKLIIMLIFTTTLSISSCGTLSGSSSSSQSNLEINELRKVTEFRTRE